MTGRHIVAIGGSDAGISAALRARELGMHQLAAQQSALAV